ncbi:MAG: hypothetical protein ACRDPG_06465 [Nocardioidaceae bacterium]
MMQRNPEHSADVQPGMHGVYRMTGLLCVTMFVLVGCGTTQPSAQRTHVASRPGSGNPAGYSTSGTHTLAQVRAAARREAAKLTSLAQIPPGAARDPAPPPTVARRLASPALGLPAVTSLVDEIRYWRVPLPLTRALRWLERHAPTGLRLDGSSTGSADDGLEYAATVPRWSSATDLDVAVASRGDGSSEIRTDGLVTWLDPRPLHVSVPRQAQLRLTVARGCPKTDNGYSGVRNPGSEPTRHLLPRPTPDAVLICRYQSDLGSAGLLARQFSAGSKPASRLAAVVRKISLSHLDGAAMNCPADFGTAVVLAFAYTGRGDVDLWYSPTGCSRLANGHVVAGSLDGSGGAPYVRFTRAMTSLVGS